MGLANQFGEQAYRCDVCGHAMALYAPHCPVCLSKTLTRVKEEKVTGGAWTADEEVPETKKPASPLISLVMVAAIVAACVVAYAIFAGPRPEAATRPEPGARAGESTAQQEAGSSSTHVAQPSRHIRHASIRPAISRPHPVSTGSLPPPPKHAVPMRLWEATSGDEDDSP